MRPTWAVSSSERSPHGSSSTPAAQRRAAEMKASVFGGGRREAWCRLVRTGGKSAGHLERRERKRRASRAERDFERAYRTRISHTTISRSVQAERVPQSFCCGLVDLSPRHRQSQPPPHTVPPQSAHSRSSRSRTG